MLSIQDLSVSFKTRRGTVDAVRGVSLDVPKGQILGIVGESGSGKSVTSYALMRILDRGGVIRQGEINYSGIDLRHATERQMAEIRGREISMIFQNPRAALNPIRKVGHQLEDVLRQHAQATRYTAKEKAIEALEAVKIKNAAERYNAYPFELSGGMCQRVVIAIALACNPKLLIADEPTTGLDITTQKAVMDLVLELIRDREMSAILITHDLGLATEYCDQISVMKNGEVVEQGTPQKIFSSPEHPYTQKLVKATPSKGSSIRDLLPDGANSPLPPRQISEVPLIEVEDLRKTYIGKSGPVDAVKGVSFKIFEGQTVGLVGESGCGKSTTSSMLVRLLDSSSGSILFNGEDLTKVPAKAFAKDPRRTDIQMVFQDATDSLNPRFTSRQSIADPLKQLLKLHGAALNERIEELASLVGLPSHLLDRFPHQLSGGQKARVGIAKAISVNPKFLILDEPTAALDVSIQAIVLNLLADLRAKLGMSFLFVSHDLQVVKLLSDYVIVMRDGEIVEQGTTDIVMNQPSSEYTRTLLSTVPKPPKGLTAA
ncbi:ABC transporter ATP-binding protein [uncultured Sneathiella sp.]|jgi:peptide/nickel transport system ATP-binding protein|uniref:ABC transporter ATP-binding protein n=1 Tax=uncultured Sneathiella sp. TaxID=879315 RepID=UPI0030DA22A1|tara:strand:- start:2046 stop:3677 length:1632 start_codon:yes stop_codon:yes gene_type:complete